jgi:hypothetical protein
MKPVRNSKWYSSALKKMRDVAWGPEAQRSLHNFFSRRHSQSTRERLDAIDAANAKRRRKQARNLERARAQS